MTLVKILEDSSLLLDAEGSYYYKWPGVFFGYNDENKFVRMHDVVGFASCEIERLPKEMMQLTDLRVLDLWDCSHLQVIPRNVISSLSRFEHLCLGESFTKWGAEGFGSGERNNACLSELNNLSYLKTLRIEIRSGL